MTDREILESIVSRLDKIDTKIETIDEKMQSMDDKIQSMDDKIESIKEDSEITRSAVNSLIEWAENVGVITQVKYPVKKS